MKYRYLILAFLLLSFAFSPSYALADGEPLRIAVIADVHIGHNGSTERLQGFVSMVNIWQPDFAIQLGDAAMGYWDEAHNKYTTIDELWNFMDKYDKLTVPHYSVIGNHDVDVVSTDNWSAIMGFPAQYSFDVKGWHFAVINTEASSDNVTAWLVPDLAASTLPTIVCTHKPLAASDNATLPMVYGDYELLQDTLEADGDVKLVLSAHAHTNDYSRINGIEYITLDSSNWLCNDSYTFLTIYPDDSIWLKGYGGQVDYGEQSVSDNTTLPQLTPPPAPTPTLSTQSTGVWGYSGGGSGTIVTNLTLENVQLKTDAVAESYDHKLELTINTGTACQNSKGGKLMSIMITKVYKDDIFCVPDDYAHLGCGYEIKPYNAVFDQPMTLTIEYNLKTVRKYTDWWLPELWRYSEDSQEWGYIENVTDPEQNIVTAEIDQLGFYALFVGTKQRVILEPTPLWTPLPWIILGY